LGVVLTTPYRKTSTMLLTIHKSLGIALIVAGIASLYFFFPLDSEANFLDQNLKVTFRYPDEIPES
jgi:hypothetical protein